MELGAGENAATDPTNKEVRAMENFIFLLYFLVVSMVSVGMGTEMIFHFSPLRTSTTGSCFHGELGNNREMREARHFFTTNWKDRQTNKHADVVWPSVLSHSSAVSIAVHREQARYDERRQRFDIGRWP